MPFDTGGIYTPPAGAESAAPGDVIRSATWNTIFTDISAALTELGQGTFVNGPRVISTPGSFTVAPADNVIYVQAPAPSITLPLSSTKVGPVRIFGVGTIFGGANASVFVRSGGDTFSGLTGFTVNTNYQVVTLYPLASGGYLLG